MPQVFNVGSYWVFFWANENKPLEPMHKKRIMDYSGIERR